MKTIRIMLTGGPGGGKTTAVHILEKHFRLKGYCVLTVPEAATNILESGLHPGQELSTEQFQELVMLEQIHNEETVSKALAMMKDKPEYKDQTVLILYDRGFPDQLAYIDEKVFEKMLRKEGIELKDIFFRYDQVFHMVSAAKGASEFYKNKDSEDAGPTDHVRMETVQEAAEKDQITQNIWCSARPVEVIDNSTDLNGKLQKVISSVDRSLAQLENSCDSECLSF